MRLRKNILVIAAVLLLLVVPTIFAQDAEQTQANVTPKVAAVVNGEEISMTELDQFANIRQLMMKLLQTDQEFASVLLQSKPGQEVINEYRKLKVNQLIINKLLVQEAKKKGIKISDKEKEKLFNDQVSALKQQNKLNDEQLEKALAQEGIESLDQYRDVFFERNEDNFLVEKLQKEAVADVSVTDEELKKFYEDNKKQFQVPAQKKVSHILFEDKSKAEEVLKEINKGGSFAEIAKANSTGPSAKNGGDIGYITENQQGLDATFAKAAFALEVGEVSEIVKTQFGYHIIKVTDSKASGVKSFAEVKDQLRKQLLNQKQSQAWSKYVQDLRENADITINI